jgi:translocation and assembly module TamB
MVVIVALVIYVAFRPDGLNLFNTYVLKPFGVSYAASEGSLSQGATWHQLHTQSIDIKTLSLDYNLTAILQGRHVIDAIRIEGVRIHLDDFIHSTQQHSAFPLPHFLINDLQLTNIQLISPYPVELDIVGKKGSFDGKKLSMKNLTVVLRSFYANAHLHATIFNNLLQAQGTLSPNKCAFDPKLGEMVGSEYPIDSLTISPTSTSLLTHIDSLSPNNDPLLSHASLALVYTYKNRYVDLKTHYLLPTYQVSMRQTFRYTFNGIMTTAFEGQLQTSLFHEVVVRGEGQKDTSGVHLNLSMDHTHAQIRSSDYDHFVWDFTTDQPSLAFLPMLPEAMRNSSLMGHGQGEYYRLENTLQGNFALHHTHADINGSMTLHNGIVTSQGDIILPPEAAMWKTWSLKPPPNVHWLITHTNDQTHLTLEGEKVAFMGTYDNNVFRGSGHYLATTFDLNGSNNTLSLATTTPSLRKLATLFPVFALPNGGSYDGELHTLSHWNYDTSLHGHSTITLPWYAITLDPKHRYSGSNNTFDIDYDAHQLTLNHYALEVADHPLLSQRPSHFHWDEHHTLFIDDFWLFDTLKIQGVFAPDTLATKLSLNSPDLYYHGPEGTAHAQVELHFSRDENETQKLEGQVTFLEGEITYLPLQKIKVMDDDVIIVQEVTPPSTSSLSMNVNIAAKKPLHYHTPEVDIALVPHFTLWKDPHNDVEILGMLTLPSGTITANKKHFILRPSHLYFGGEIPFNPYLDIRLDHEVDYKKIRMYLTNRLDSPVFIFGSDPIMTQNEIMSYILFGSSADASADTTTTHNVTARADATNFMLGAGLKELINGVTKLNIDTMNILTTKEGGMGFEVGTHLAKDLRILYKNDAISSVLVQYQINQWLRLDADVHSLGQGINLLYIKDFYDFLPHNEIQKSKQ